MKLGDRVFYEIESSRQEWLQAWYGVPYMGAGLGLIILCGFAYKVPIQSKLYREFFISMAMGTGLATV